MLSWPRCIRHSEIFMEGYRTWEGRGGKNERKKERNETGVLFSGRKVGRCGGRRSRSYYYRFLAITIMSRSREGEVGEGGTKMNPRGESREAAERGRERACKSPSAPSAQSGVCHRFNRAAERSPSECKTCTAPWGVSVGRVGTCQLIWANESSIPGTILLVSYRK